MSLFDKKRHISRRGLREVLRRAPAEVSGAGGKTFSQRERVKMEKEVFGKRYGGIISKTEYKRALQNLERTKQKAFTGRKRLKLDKKIKFLKGLTESEKF